TSFRAGSTACASRASARTGERGRLQSSAGMSRLPRAYEAGDGRPTRCGREAAAFRDLCAAGICGRRFRPCAMRVGLICPVWFPVPPEAYGGTERVVALLADGLVDAGHEVTLFASGDSQTRARLEAVFHTAP